MDIISTDVLIIGAGASGLMCAIEAGKRGRSVIVLEHNDQVGKKIRISGGGRCNFTNIHASADHFLSNNPHFAKSAFSRFTPQDFVTLVKKHNIAFHEKALGQLFCDTSSQNIIAMLKKECAAANVQILTNTHINQVSKKDVFILNTNQGEFQCQSLVVASGGLSIPSLGTSDIGYTLAKQFDIQVNPCRPGLVPLTFKAKELNIFKNLSGLSLDVIVSFQNAHFREKMLFTHKGLSGPAILQISSYWQAGQPILINLVPKFPMFDVFKNHHHSKLTLKNFLKDYLPARLADVFVDHYLKDKPLTQTSLEELQNSATLLHNWPIIPQGTEGYAKAEVTVGGIDPNELSSKTMAAKKVSGLYFIGEVVDVTGWLGGFNFQWAWASGFAAGQYV
ncbi:MAG: NAD(P)/FAD-dependent oxidoreductase [Candidatus Omnitrophica bacterium]|nr:NAD(P)/FAD-dependent oxidoreductase [Candidatus Omnitrophota bacterium]